MTVEYDAVFVEDLDPELPADSDDISEGNDHIMLVKQVLQNTFPSATQALTADFEYLNQLPTRITLTDSPESDVDATDVLTLDMNGNRITNIHDAFSDTDVPSFLQTKNLIMEALQVAIYPVGSLYTSRNNTNPADILGFGTWEVVSGGIFGAGVFQSANGTTQKNYVAGNQYGSPDHYIEVGNVPELDYDWGAETDVTIVEAGTHQHDSAWGENVEGSGVTAPFGTSGRYNGIGSGDTDYDNEGFLTSTAGSHSHALKGVQKIGNAQPTPMDTLSPINVFNIWERTA